MVGRGEDIADVEILRLFADSEEPFLGTSEVADNLDYSDTGIRERLYKLAEEGFLDFKRVGNSPAFWITDDGKAQIEDH